MNEKQWYFMCWETYLDVWKFFQKHRRLDPIDWEAVHKEAHEIKKRHPSRMCEELLLTMIDVLDKKESAIK